MNPTPGALKLLLEYENAQIEKQRGELSHIGSFVARWPEWCWRLSGVLHAAKWDEDALQYPLDESTVSAAIRVVGWLSQEQMKILYQDQATAKSRLYQKVLALLNDKPGGIVAADVYRKRIVCDAEEARHLLKQMEANGLLRCSEVSTPVHGGHETRRFVSAAG